MNLEEATKKVRAEKTKDNFMVFEFSYDKKILLPHKDGVVLLQALANAEQLLDGYGDPKRINEMPKDAYSVKGFSHQDYERYKIAALLSVSPDEVKAAQEAANQPTPTT